MHGTTRIALHSRSRRTETRDRATDVGVICLPQCLDCLRHRALIFGKLIVDLRDPGIDVLGAANTLSQPQRNLGQGRRATRQYRGSQSSNDSTLLMVVGKSGWVLPRVCELPGIIELGRSPVSCCYLRIRVPVNSVNLTDVRLSGRCPLPSARVRVVHGLLHRMLASDRRSPPSVTT